jgi:uncharacterized membrane protein
MSMKVLFSGSRFIFWAVAPLLIVCAVALSLTASLSTPLHLAAIVLVDTFILLLVIGLYNPRRNQWALRCVTALVFLAYVAYWIDELREGKLLPSADRGVESILAATLGLVVIGWPCFKFTWRGFAVFNDSQDKDESEIDREQ